MPRSARHCARLKLLLIEQRNGRNHHASCMILCHQQRAHGSCSWLTLAGSATVYSVMDLITETIDGVKKRFHSAHMRVPAENDDGVRRTATDEKRTRERVRHR